MKSFERLDIRLIVTFGHFPCSFIRIRTRIPNRDPDTGEPNQCGSRSGSGSGSGSETLLERSTNEQHIDLYVRQLLQAGDGGGDVSV
jgi:hypothetical protein